MSPKKRREKLERKRTTRGARAQEKREEKENEEEGWKVAMDVGRERGVMQSSSQPSRRNLYLLLCYVSSYFCYTQQRKILAFTIMHPSTLSTA